MTTIEALAELPRDRPGGDLQGDAGREGRRYARARARSRRRPARGGEAGRGARHRRSGRPTEEEIREAFGADPGSLGPVGFDGEIVADETLREGQFVAGANRTGWHLRGVEAGRDFEPRFADIREPREGDACPRCGGALRFQTAIEVGHIFKLGTRYSVPLGASSWTRTGRSGRSSWAGTASGPGRIIAAAVEQRHDERRDRRGRARSRRTTSTSSRSAPRGPRRVGIAERVAGELEAAGLAVLLDDRDRAPGREVRRRRPDRLSRPRHGRQEDARGRQGRRARPRRPRRGAGAGDARRQRVT